MEKTNFLVVPTIRQPDIVAFLKAWRNLPQTWDKIMVVEDNPSKTFPIDVDYHYCWEDVEKELGENQWIISRRDSAIRCFGHYMAWKMGATHTFALDDDCFPVNNTFIQDHLKALYEHPQWTESIPGFRTRGLPYERKGVLGSVMANMGTWHGIPDLDAVQALNSPSKGHYRAPDLSRIIPCGQFFPFCGMNFCFRREVAVLSYFPLMGEGQPFRRFDDIWFGVIFKKICDHLQFRVACGNPSILHKRASHPLVNLVKEAPGIQFHEEFWGMVDACPLSSQTPHACMAEMGEWLKTRPHGYVSVLGKAILAWAGLFGK